MTTLIVDQDDVARVSQAFPSMTVAGVLWYAEDPHSLDLAPHRGQEVIVWATDGELIAYDLTGVAARVGLVNGGKLPVDLPAELLTTYARKYVSPYKAPRTRPVAEEAQGLPAAAQTARDAPAQAGAAVEVSTTASTVVSMVEARTRRQAKPKPDMLEGSPPFSHDAIAREFTRLHGDLWRYVAGWGKWLQWTGQRWLTDLTGSVSEESRLICRQQADDAYAAGMAANTVRGIAGAGTIAAVEKIARTDPAHARTVDIWDADPWLLNTPTGIVDLRTGQLRPARQDDHCAKMTQVGYDAQAMCPRWMESLVQATGADADLMTFLQRMVGYCLTGSIREHAVFFVWGQGGNGKGTFLNTLTWLLGDYAAVTSTDTFTEVRNEGHPTSLAALNGRRLVAAQEVEEGRRWAEAKLKSLSGGDPITARFMHCDEFTFAPQFKLMIVGNNKPILRNVDDAIRRRLYMIPFTQKPKEIDNMLTEKLRGEAAGILRWAVAGCLQWLERGLEPPAIVRDTTAAYLTSQDTLATWIAECCETCAEEFEFKRIWDCYKNWCEGEHLGRKRFSMALEAKGFAVITKSGRTVVQGLRLNAAQGTQARLDYLPD